MNSAPGKVPFGSPTFDITYTVTVTSRDGCVGSNSVFVKVIRDFVVPNTFTPNGDGINDKWVIEFLYLYPRHHIEVFNRYGQLVYESLNYSTPWDGTYKGNALPAGTYYYIIELGGKRPAKSGYVTILR